MHRLRNCVRAVPTKTTCPPATSAPGRAYQVGEDQRPWSIPPTAPSTLPALDPRRPQELLRPKLCNHCAHSPCVQVCPVGATFVSPDGVVLVDQTYCLGCRYCVQACPYGCRYLHPETKTVDKCTLCYHRITQGSPPPAAKTAPPARASGDFKNPQDPVHEFLRHNKVQVLKPYMATGAKLYYKNLDGS